MKWKAFAVWIAVPFLSSIVVAKVLYRLYGHADASPRYSFGILAFILAVCTGLAALGTIAVWMLPIRRVWLGIVSGVVAAIGTVALAARLAMIFYGGFENNIGICLGVLFLTPGSCLAGAMRACCAPEKTKQLEGIDWCEI
jgi:hypothetical protein